MTFSSRPATSGPSVARPFRFSSQSETLRPSNKIAGNKGSDFLTGGKLRRASTQSTPKGGEKGKKSVDSGDSTSYDADPFAANYNPSTSFTSYESYPRPSTADDTSTLPKRSRGSLLIAASDAINFTFGRRRKPVRQAPLMPLLLPEVIEISGPRRDEELEERERLRDAAAQSIGLGPEMRQESHSIDGSLEEEDEPDEEASPEEVQVETDDTRTFEHNLPARLTLDSTAPSFSQSMNGRHRSGSLAHSIAHSRTDSRSMTPTSLPMFPTILSALSSFIQTSAMLPKYYPPSSLRIFALSKHWKTRFMILSSPALPGHRGSAPAVSYLHLFKSSAPDDKEIERLEINEESVVFLTDEEVGGRRSVVKVGGVDVGAQKKDLNHEEGGRTMWLLQIVDASEAHRWIAVIKNAILGQRSMRAGLGIPANLGGIEPRGDMDVMLSMRAQGLIPSPTQSKFTIPDFTGSRSSGSSTRSPTMIAAHLPIGPDQTPPDSSSRSIRSQSTGRTGSAVSTLKGLFSSSTRPRSPSRATSTAGSTEEDKDTTEDSFGNMGNNLLNMLRSNGTADASMSVPASPPLGPSRSPSGPLTRFSLSASSISTPEQRLDRKILQDTRPASWLPRDEAVDDKPTRALSIGSLNPPPRKRPWMSIGSTASVSQGAGMYKHSQGNDSIAGSFGVGSLQEALYSRPPASPTKDSLGSLEQRARAPSVNSASTLASGENSALERSSSSTKRRSRQGILLPKRLTPPSGPPPSVPVAVSSSPRSSLSTPRVHTPQHPYAADQSRSRPSSIRSGVSPKTVVSSLPTFSKRASGSSALSVSSFSSSHERANGSSASHTVSSHRASMPPPPRPAPNFAPPPIPSQEAWSKDTNSVPAPKVSFRDSVAHRARRLSLVSPKPPPSTDLPPRPDEPTTKSHRRNSSGGPRISQLGSIPASPLPPPDSPLPAPPSTTPASRHTSFKQRLRILSAPSPIAGPSSPLPAIPQPIFRAISPYPSTIDAYSPPSTPLGERITTLQNDPNFLQLYTPSTPTIPINIPPDRPEHEHQYSSPPELTSLSPPPRRASKQMGSLDIEKTGSVGDSVREEDHRSSADGVEKKLLPLSQRGSVVSLGFVSV